MNPTDWLKAELWRRFGAPGTTAEWDGKVYGGGKASQRFWEYLKTIEYLEIDADSVVLDIGGGSPATGAGFLASLVAERARAVIVIDAALRVGKVPGAGEVPKNVDLIARSASYDELRGLLTARRDVTHISCVSVLEHIEPEARKGLVQAVNEFFTGRVFAATFEFHSRTQFFKHQLTTRTMSEMFEPLTAFYLDRLEASPVLAENAFDTRRLARLSRREPWAPADIPRWFPLAVRFVGLAKAGS